MQERGVLRQHTECATDRMLQPRAEAVAEGGMHTSQPRGPQLKAKATTNKQMVTTIAVPAA